MGLGADSTCTDTLIEKRVLFIHALRSSYIRRVLLKISPHPLSLYGGDFSAGTNDSEVGGGGGGGSGVHANGQLITLPVTFNSNVTTIIKPVVSRG